MQIFSKNLWADLLRMPARYYINISGNTIKITQNLKSQTYVDYVVACTVKAELNDLVEQMH